MNVHQSFLPVTNQDEPAALIHYMDGLRAHDVEQIASTFADEIRFVTPVKSMGRHEIVAFLAALYRGFPDWAYENEPPRRLKDGSWAVRWKQGGKHTGRLEFAGFPGVDPTWRKVEIPEHDFFYRLEHGKLVEIRPDPIPGGAPRGIFEQIGVELPPL